MAAGVAGPRLLPIAIHACHVLAANRHSLSKVFFRKKDQQVRKELHRMETVVCTDGVCAVK